MSLLKNIGRLFKKQHPFSPPPPFRNSFLHHFTPFNLLIAILHTQVKFANPILTNIAIMPSNICKFHYFCLCGYNGINFLVVASFFHFSVPCPAALQIHLLYFHTSEMCIIFFPNDSIAFVSVAVASLQWKHLPCFIKHLLRPTQRLFNYFIEFTLINPIICAPSATILRLNKLGQQVRSDLQLLHPTPPPTQRKKVRNSGSTHTFSSSYSPSLCLLPTTSKS